MGVLAAYHDVSMTHPDVQRTLQGGGTQHAYQLSGAQPQGGQATGKLLFRLDGLNFRGLAGMKLVQWEVHDPSATIIKMRNILIYIMAGGFCKVFLARVSPPG